MSRVKYCPDCGAPVDKDDNVCPKCKHMFDVKKSKSGYTWKDKSKDERKLEIQGKLFGVFLFLVGIGTIALCIRHEYYYSDDSSSSNDTQTESTMIAETTAEVQTTEATGNFTSELAEYIGDDSAEEAQRILVHDIGFSDLEFDSQLGTTGNYKIYADGTGMVLTATDGYYRVFIPDTDYVFYEDGNVVMTAADYADMTIDIDDMRVYYIMAQDAVLQCLDNPDSADFPSLNRHPEEIGFAKIDSLITVQSYVESENALGGTVRNEWTVQFVPIDTSEYTYDLMYISVGGTVMYGEYTSVN